MATITTKEEFSQDKIEEEVFEMMNKEFGPLHENYSDYGSGPYWRPEKGICVFYDGDVFHDDGTVGEFMTFFDYILDDVDEEKLLTTQPCYSQTSANHEFSMEKVKESIQEFKRLNC